MEAVTDPRFGQEIRRARGLRFDLLSELVHEDSKIVDLVAISVTPDRLQELAMREHLVRVRNEVPEKLEFLGGEAHLPAAGVDLAGIEIPFNRSEHQTSARAVCRRRASEGRTNTRQELGRIEGL